MAEMIPAIAQKIAIDCSRHSPCIELAYTYGGAGEALILIHGLGGGSRSWRQGPCGAGRRRGRGGGHETFLEAGLFAGEPDLAEV